MTLSPSGPCSLPPLSLSTLAASKLWTQGLSGACRGRQPPNPVVDTGSQASQQPGCSPGGKNSGSGRSSVRPWRRNYRLALKKFWQTVQCLRRGKQRSENSLQCGGGAVDLNWGHCRMVEGILQEDLLNPTDMPSTEEAEAEGLSEMDSSKPKPKSLR
ncbi:hypothetical protein L3Q82_026878 [Scortum barcoo]|uniref:Uncharacterized protein n=1 Tax=Scortum barcoo TaxID=214431 RepID=A0ACB8WJT7_9TELE|nr:hypothetical protein L3Q82_026878 [Scortum barcoo]